MKIKIYTFKEKTIGVDFMRGLFTIILITFMILGSWFLVNNSLAKNTEYMKVILKDLDADIQNDNWSNASTNFIKFKEKWIDLRSLWTIILDHHEIDNIDLSVAKADKYIHTKSKPLSLAEVEVLQSLIEIVRESESLSLSNIF